MRVESSVVCVSWLPAASVHEWLRAGCVVGLASFDAPPAGAPDDVLALRGDDRFVMANVLRAWAEFDELGAPLEWGVEPTSGVVMGSSTVHVAGAGATFGGYPLPTLAEEPVVEPGSVHLVQTAGGRTGLPLPRPSGGLTLWQAPLVWTTLALTLRADGTAEGAVPATSAFPQHWLYDADGTVRSHGVSDLDEWLAAADRTPWGTPEDPRLARDVDHAVAGRLADGVLRRGSVPLVRTAAPGTALTTQGETARELVVLLDGVATVSVDGEDVARLGPGAVVGEDPVRRAAPAGATVTALTPVRIAVAPAQDLDTEKLAAVAELRA